MNKVLKIAAGVATALILAGCTSDADRVNENLNTDAEQFNVQRTIVFYNGITGENIAVIEGKCSIERNADMMQAICKVGPGKDGKGEYTRDEVGRADNVTYFALQTKPTSQDPYHKKIVIKPGNALPGFDVEVGPGGGQR
jgi:hypothetical protein